MSNQLSKLLNIKPADPADGARVEFSSFPEHGAFPLIARPRSAGLLLREWVRENMDLLNEKLDRHGAVLFRGFHINTAEKFEDFIGAFEIKPLEYKQRSSPRFEVARNIYHSTTYPADQSINMHSENSYTAKWPMKIIFCCVVPADEQGETPISDNRSMLNLLSPSTRDQFLRKGVKYVRNISNSAGLSWKEVFQTEDRAVVGAECSTNGMNYEWRGDDSLLLSWTGKAIHTHPRTGEPVWFNHAFFFHRYALPKEIRAGLASDEELPFQTYFGDGSEIPEEMIQEIREAYRQASFAFPWTRGDVLYMDNMLMAHGRRPYKGNRQILVSLF